MNQYTEKDVDSLADKIASLDLTEAEQAVLANFLGRVAADEVEGFDIGASLVAHELTHVRVRAALGGALVKAIPIGDVGSVRRRPDALDECEEEYR